MKKFRISLKHTAVVAACFAVSIMLFTGCNKDDDPKTGTGIAETEKLYVSSTANGEKVYTLKVTQSLTKSTATSGDTYVLLYVDNAGVVKTSAGAVTSSDENTLVLAPASGAAFTVTVTKDGVTGISGNITFTDNTTATGGTLTPMGTGGEIELPVGEIAEDRVLGVPGMALNYVYNGDGLLTVKNSATLVALPGTTIRFSKTGSGIEIRENATVKMLGTDKLYALDAEGKLSSTPSASSGHITLKGGAAKGSWNGVYIKTKKENQLIYVDMLNGGSRTDDFNNAAVLNIEAAKAGISHCTVSGGKVYGIAMWDDFTLTAFDNNKVENCDAEPVWFRGQFSRIGKFDVTSDFTNNTKPYIHISVPQDVTESATLNETSVPYYFAEGGMDYLNADLTIGAGVTVYMGEATGFGTGQNRTGKLNMNGTAQKPVTFTRVPGTNYHWKAIHLAGSSHKIKNCILEYGGNSWNGWEDAGILNVAFETSIEFENVTVRNSINYGIHILHFDDCSYTGGNTVTFGAGAQANAGGNVRVWGNTCDTGCVFNALP